MASITGDGACRRPCPGWLGEGQGGHTASADASAIDAATSAAGSSQAGEQAHHLSREAAAAAIVASISSSPCRVDRNNASYWLHGR